MREATRLTIHSTGATNEDAVLLHQPSRHSNRLIITYPDSIIDELAAYVKVVRHTINTNAFNDCVDLVPSSCSFSLLGVEHDTVFDAIEQTTARRVGEHYLDIR